MKRNREVEPTVWTECVDCGQLQLQPVGRFKRRPMGCPRCATGEMVEVVR